MNRNWIRKILSTALLAGLTGCVSNSSFSDLSTKTKQLGKQVSNSLTIKPKVIPAADPVSLASQPKPIPAEFYTQAAWSAEQQGNPAAAANQYEKALEISPRDVATLLSYARFLDRSGRPDDALRIYQRAQAVEPNTAMVWNDLGLFHARRNQWQPALAALNQAVALQPNQLRYRNNLAAVLVQTQHPEQAVLELEKVHPPAVARYNVGCVLCQLHNDAAAVEYFVQAVRIDPSLTAAQGMLAKLQPPVGSPSDLASPPAPSQLPAERVAEQPRRLPASDPDAPARY
ncbi:MAG: tetratricopeptide repeat protein [Planctomycetota bacterium]|nr:tetratricopeptide repeat protein [Planctomycetota bacterium]